MSLAVTERSISTPTGTVKVRRGSSNSVDVLWHCGDRFALTPESLKDAIEHLRTMRALPDAWLRLVDPYGRTVFVRLDEHGDLRAKAGVTQSAYHGVEWTVLRKALKRAVKELP